MHGDIQGASWDHLITHCRHKMATRKKTRKGILAGGNWIIDQVKMIDVFPKTESLANSSIVGGAVFDVCVRYLREDPWERMRILSEWITKTPLIIHTRGQSLFTFEFFPDDVVALSAERFAANGMRYHTPYDALNDIRNLEIPITEAKRHGLTVVPGIVFTESPVHTDDYYVEKTKQVMALGVDGVFIKDPSGLLRPERATSLVKRMKAVMGDMPLQLHSHCLSGLAPYTALCAVKNGVEVVHSATAPLANGASHPSTQALANNLRRMGYDVDLDLNRIDEVSEILKKMLLVIISKYE